MAGVMRLGGDRHVFASAASACLGMLLFSAFVICYGRTSIASANLALLWVRWH